MNTELFGEKERDGMRAAGRFNAQLMDYLRPHVKAGVTTETLDKLAYDYTLQHGHKPACLGYKGYPKTICTSVNEVVCHGIPDDYALQDGDIVNVDITTIVDGYYGDQSETFLIGKVSDLARQLTQVTFECLYIGIDAINPSAR
ncbi:MAG: M24 family metallopeptidase [Planctomycetales bacterium]